MPPAGRLGHNSQPWQFVIVDDKKTIADLVDIAVEQYNEVQRTRQDLVELIQTWYGWMRWSEEELEAGGDGMFMNSMSREVWKKMRTTSSEQELRGYVMEMLSPRARAAHINGSPCVLFTLLDRSKAIPNFSQDIMELTGVGGAIQNLRLAIHRAGAWGA
jgi:nitroreductase